MRQPGFAVNGGSQSPGTAMAGDVVPLIFFVNYLWPPNGPRREHMPYRACKKKPRSASSMVNDGQDHFAHFRHN
jgi:hypothetical protein